jgi:hypothetical protein
MTRIKIEDLPRDQNISSTEMKRITGGGGFYQGRAINFFTNPWALGAVVAAAIAVPLAIDDSDDAS